MKTCKQTLDVAALSKSVSKLPLSSLRSLHHKPLEPAVFVFIGTKQCCCLHSTTEDRY